MSASYPLTYYSKTMKGEQKYPFLNHTIEADVCIIGGGLAGLAIALGLLERGKKPVILEGGRIGWGASGRNGGFVMAGYAAGVADITKKVGLTNAKKLYSLTKQSQQLIRKRSDDYKIDCDPVHGYLKPSWYDVPGSMEERADFLAKNFDEPVEFWPQDKVREHAVSERYYDGIYFPDYFHMHPLNYVQGLGRVITEKGGLIFEDSMAVRVENEQATTKIIHTEHGKVKAPHIVYCGSGYFNRLETKIKRSCLPISTYVMVTDPVDEKLLKTAINTQAGIQDTRWSDDYYRILPDKRILWGGRVGLSHSAPTGDLLNVMIGDLHKVYPQLESVKPAIAWSGLMGYTVHKMPHIGKMADGVWYCTNFGGNGVGPTTAGGEVIAAAIADGDKTYELFKPFGFAYTGGMLGPLVAQAVYYSWQLGDWMREIKHKFF